MLVEQIMSRPAVTCSASDALGRAAQLLWDHDLGSLPVVDADGRLVGMITDRDICMAAYLRGQPLGDIAVEQAMARQVFACSPGVLSLTDLAREAEHEDGRRLPQVTDAEVSRTLASICEPRRDEGATL
jgi:CBS domain-containing protein